MGYQVRQQQGKEERKEEERIGIICRAGTVDGPSALPLCTIAHNRRHFFFFSFFSFLVCCIRALLFSSFILFILHRPLSLRRFGHPSLPQLAIALVVGLGSALVDGVCIFILLTLYALPGVARAYLELYRFCRSCLKTAFNSRLDCVYVGMSLPFWLLAFILLLPLCALAYVFLVVSGCLAGLVCAYKSYHEGLLQSLRFCLSLVVQAEKALVDFVGVNIALCASSKKGKSCSKTSAYRYVVLSAPFVPYAEDYERFQKKPVAPFVYDALPDANENAQEEPAAAAAAAGGGEGAVPSDASTASSKANRRHKASKQQQQQQQNQTHAGQQNNKKHGGGGGGGGSNNSHAEARDISAF